ncbi:hypothetical protein AB4440_06960 [Vibrio splendidus]|uniref:hypothetical protein n=1 Tax=Vibrio splendidus TaxID=29497 RepID=UPI000C83B58F|nr:hypothetical protein [Vibrio splendidus]PMO94713.1 hypothetical protein BCS97_16670 [Vibrio splendidus]PMP20145.1 hypothetical protein BCS89_03955 [Vibrio splendidus]PMP36842.1 hypothetical protein BCS88_05510 [Vibrio splendidus]PMP41711.1 hypothetical protein BCS87_05630 [Vibrio splendidus]PMP45726.1 hypothetical protein BCS85_16815 [Vibrio splendidus]
MKVAYFIYTLHTGVGGHYFSLSSIANEMESKIDDYFVVNIGFNKSKVLNKEINSTIYNVKDSLLPNPLVLIKLLKILREEKCDVIHCFDDGSFFYARLASLILGVSVVLTKCGGPSPNKYYPTNNIVTVFSKEDHEYFIARGVNTILIPNRVRLSPVQRSDLSVELVNKIKGQSIICIARISKAYEKKINQAIHFSQKLRACNIPNTLLVIGVVEDHDVYSKLISGEDLDNVFFITEDKYTASASEYIHYADIVVGTGRGLMEGALQNKLLMCPDNFNDRLVFVDESNIDSFFSFNFSGRYASNSNNLSSLVDIINKNKVANYSAAIQDYAEKNFLLKGATDKYLSIYQINQKNNHSFWDIFKHFVYFSYVKLNKSGLIDKIRRFK